MKFGVSEPKNTHIRTPKEHATNTRSTCQYVPAARSTCQYVPAAEQCQYVPRTWNTWNTWPLRSRTQPQNTGVTYFPGAYSGRGAIFYLCFFVFFLAR